MRVNKMPEVRRQEVVNVARRLFIEQGFNKTSIAQIAQAVGVAKGLFYYYFETKEDVLENVVEDMCDDHIQYLIKRFDEKGTDFFKRLLILMDVYYEVHPFFNSENQRSIEADSRVTIAFHTRYLERIESILHEVVEEGKLLGLLQLEYPELMVISTLEGIFGLTRLISLSKKTATIIIEQSLNLPCGSLQEDSQFLLTNFS